MNMSKLITGVAALGLLFTTGTALANGNGGYAPAKYTYGKPGTGGSNFRRTAAFISQQTQETDFAFQHGGSQFSGSVYKSKFIESAPGLHVLRELDVVVLRELREIPHQSIVQCGSVCPREHVIAGKIQDAGKREQLRGWVRTHGESWKQAVEEALAEKLGE